MPSRTPRKQPDRRKPQAATVRTPSRGTSRVARMVPSGSDGQATINDIARLAGVSKKTVSRVINRSPLVRADTRKRSRH